MKNTIKKIAEKYSMEIVRHHITQEALFLQVTTEVIEPELEHLVDTLTEPELFADRTTDYEHTYRIYCPTSWFDLWGWAD
jgi:hypothetical protein